MINYRYKARDKFGKLVNGVVEAESESALVAQLEQMNYVTLKIAPAKKKMKPDGFRGWMKRGRVKFSDLSMFTRLLFTLQNAGLPLLKSLNAIREQIINQTFKEVIGKVAKDVENGVKLSVALQKHPEVFDNLYVNMIESGEISGKLPDVLERLAILGEHDESIRVRVKAALRYPAIVITSIIIAFLIIVTAIVPRYESLFSQFDTRLPLPTLILLGFNYAVTKFWWLSLIVLGALGFWFRKTIQSPKGLMMWHALQLKVPIFGSLLLKLFMSRFCRITGMLLKSGVPILQILNLVSRSISNVVVSNVIKDIRESVREGKGMFEPMKACGLFPPIVIQMVSAGEESGQVDSLLVYVADYYDDQIDHMISNLVTLIEPFLLLIMGSGVTLIALGIFMPMWNLMSLFKH